MSSSTYIAQHHEGQAEVPGKCHHLPNVSRNRLVNLAQAEDVSCGPGTSQAETRSAQRA